MESPLVGRIVDSGPGGELSLPVDLDVQQNRTVSMGVGQRPASVQVNDVIVDTDQDATVAGSGLRTLLVGHVNLSGK